MGVVPAFQVLRRRVSAAVGGVRITATRRRSLVHGVLISSEVALTIVLLVLASLLVRSVLALQGVAWETRLSQLARRGFRRAPAGDDDGLPVFRVAAGAPPITSEDVQKALSEWP